MDPETFEVYLAQQPHDPLWDRARTLWAQGKARLAHLPEPCAGAYPDALEGPHVTLAWSYPHVYFDLQCYATGVEWFFSDRATNFYYAGNAVPEPELSPEGWAHWQRALEIPT
jgi:hypothetical protein